MRLEMIVATLRWSGWKECVESWQLTSDDFFAGRCISGKDVLEAYQQGFEESKADILGYCHDDLVITEKGWDTRVLKEFEDPTVGVVGFGGSWGHGDPHMYHKPYENVLLARRGFMSNMRDAEVNGSRFTGQRDVASLDGFSIFVRREVLEKAGGWPLDTPVGYFCYDYWICCMAHRLGYKVRLVGVACDHLNGKSTGLNPNLKADFTAAHRYIYDNFKDVLPWEVK